MKYFGGFNDVNPFQYPGIDYAEASATVNTTTTSSTYSLLNSMTITPLEGTHVLIFSTSASATVLLGAPDVFFQVYVGGVPVAHTERVIEDSVGDALNVSINCLVTVNGNQAVEVRWRTSAGTATCLKRSLNIIKLADA